MSGIVFPEPAGNDLLLSELRTMHRAGKLPHALLFHGERGCGKKLLAKWTAAMALCEQPDSAPCGHCRNCRLVAADSHPDVTSAAHSGKRMGFSVETVREIRRDAAVKPNSGALRIFIFADADGMSIQAQNALLKSVEEPPPHACFIFTVETIGTLLPTLLSRMTAKAVFPVDEEACTGALTRRGFSPGDVQTAITHFGGNIGKCIAFLEDEAQRKAAETAAALTDALAAGNEYELLRLLSEASADRETLRKTLLLFDAQIRDAASLMLGAGENRLGCDPEAANALSIRLTPRRVLKMHGAISLALEDLDGNVGGMLTVSALAAALLR